MAYRKIDEGDALLTLADIRSTGGTARYFYRVDNSTLWFDQERSDRGSNHAILHYSVAASNDIIDVLALGPPVVVAD